MKKYFAFIIISIIAVFFASCRTDQENKLIGTWEQIPFTDPETTTVKTMWHFYAGGALTIYRISSEKTDSLQYSYDISGQVLDVLSGVDDFTYLVAARDPRGQYWVDLLTNSQFKGTKRKHPDGTTDAVFMRVEMVKR